MPPKELNFITGNKHKLAEVSAIIGEIIQLKSQNVDLPEMQGTIDEISKDKCRRAANQNFEAKLTKARRKWFLEAVGPDGMHKLLAGFEDKSAQAICTFAYSEGPDHDPILFQGRTDGNIVPARGPRDFGWDSAFEYEGLTYAEMAKSKKNEISHRGKALGKLKEWLAGQN